MKRILPEQVVKAYEKTGLLPTTEVFLELYRDGKPTHDKDFGLDCGCGIGVLLLQKLKYNTKINFQIEGLECAASVLGIGLTYTDGFAEGFDGKSPDHAIPSINYIEERYFQGYCDGIDAHLATIKWFDKKYNK